MVIAIIKDDGEKIPGGLKLDPADQARQVDGRIARRTVDVVNESRPLHHQCIVPGRISDLIRPVTPEGERKGSLPDADALDLSQKIKLQPLADIDEIRGDFVEAPDGGKALPGDPEELEHDHEKERAGKQVEHQFPYDEPALFSHTSSLTVDRSLSLTRNRLDPSGCGHVSM